MQVIQDFEGFFVALLRLLNGFCFGDALLRVGQVAFSGRLLCQMRLQTLFVVRFADRAAGGNPYPGYPPEYQKPLLTDGYGHSLNFGAASACHLRNRQNVERSNLRP